MDLVLVNEDILEFTFVETPIWYIKLLSATYASTKSLSRARAHSGVVSECFNKIEFPRIIGEMQALKGIQKGEL